MGKLFEELKRRKVFRVAAVYAVVAWLIIQVAGEVLPTFSAPVWVSQTLIFLLILGLPITLVVAWAFDLTPDGIKSATIAQSTESVPQTTGQLLPNIMLGLVLLAVGFLVVDQYLFTGNERANQAGQTNANNSQTIRFSESIDSMSALRGRQNITIAPDGSSYAFIGNNGPYVRDMQALNPRLLTALDQRINFPVISPAADELLYWNSETLELRRIGIRGGAPVTVAGDVSDPYGVNWVDDGRIFYAQREGIFVVNASGSSARERVVDSPVGLITTGPNLLPDGDTLLYSLSRTADWDSGQIMARSLSTGTETVVLNGGMAAKYVAPGFIIYALGESLYGVRFDLDSLSIEGQPQLLIEGVERSYRPWQSGSATYDISANGTLIYRRAQKSFARSIVSVDRAGIESVLSIEPRAYSSLMISPDGRELVINEGDADNSVWVWDFERQTQTRLSLGEMGGDNPIWSADGNRIAYHPSTGTIIDWHTANNTGIPETLIQGTDEDFDPFHPEDFSDDGNYLVFHTRAPATGIDLAIVDLNRGEVQGRVADPFTQRGADIAPNGRWMAYQSDESGRYEIYIRSFPNVSENRVVASSSGGASGRWSDDGSELFFIQPGNPAMLMSISVSEQGDELLLQDLRQVLEWPYSEFSFDVSNDGQSFITIKPLEDESSVGPEGGASLVIVQNWIEEVIANMQQ